MWRDPRLAYHELAPQTHQIETESWGVDLIWIPTIYLTNDKHSTKVSVPVDNALITVTADGNVTFLFR